MSSLLTGQTETNRTIPDPVDFIKTFFTKHTLLNILTKYCVFTTEELLLVMRPYLLHQNVFLNRNLTIATIFSFAQNEEQSADGILEDESFDTDELDQSSCDFLGMAI